MKRILGIGNALVDVITMLDDDQMLKEFNLPKGSMQLVDREKSDKIKSLTSYLPRTWISGGSAANTIHGIAMLGADGGFIGSVGKDETGDFFENEMRKAGVKTCLLRRDLVTGTSVALVSHDTERTFATHLGAAVELSSQDLDPCMFEDFDILYLEGYLINNFQLIESACMVAKENNMLVALDLASYNVVEAFRDSFKHIVGKYVDILFANDQEAREFTGLEPEKALDVLAGQSDIVVLKTGANGSWIRNKERLIKIDAFPVNCIDTTGAGDLYASGFLYGFSMDQDLEKCGKIGAYMAAKVIETVGARIEKGKFVEIGNEIKKLI